MTPICGDASTTHAHAGDDMAKEYILTVAKDVNGQPRSPFKFCKDNNTSKAIDRLSGICTGILADGTVNEAEARFFADWVKEVTALEPVWPFTDILARIEKIFADGNCSEEERGELKEIMEAICGGTFQPGGETKSSELPLCVPHPAPIHFQDRNFSITGKFAFGARKAVISAIQSRGGKAFDTAPTHDTNYLLIGIFASRDWIHSNYGRKIERAVQLRESGSGIHIVSEEHWKGFLV